jgi:hypothetical protein
MDAQCGLVGINRFQLARAIARPESVDPQLLLVRLRNARQSVDAPFGPDPIARFYMVSPASELMAGGSRLFGGEITLLLLDGSNRTSGAILAWRRIAQIYKAVV